MVEVDRGRPGLPSGSWRCAGDREPGAHHGRGFTTARPRTEHAVLAEFLLANLEAGRRRDRRPGSSSRPRPSRGIRAAILRRRGSLRAARPDRFVCFGRAYRLDVQDGSSRAEVFAGAHAAEVVGRYLDRVAGSSAVVIRVVVLRQAGAQDTALARRLGSSRRWVGLVLRQGAEARRSPGPPLDDSPISRLRMALDRVELVGRVGGRGVAAEEAGELLVSRRPTRPWRCGRRGRAPCGAATPRQRRDRRADVERRESGWASATVARTSRSRGS